MVGHSSNGIVFLESQISEESIPMDVTINTSSFTSSQVSHVILAEANTALSITSSTFRNISTLVDGAVFEQPYDAYGNVRFTNCTMENNIAENAGVLSMKSINQLFMTNCIV